MLKAIKIKQNKTTILILLLSLHVQGGSLGTVRIIVCQTKFSFCLLRVVSICHCTVEEPINEVAVNEVSCARGQLERMLSWSQFILLRGMRLRWQQVMENMLRVSHNAFEERFVCRFA